MGYECFRRQKSKGYVYIKVRDGEPMVLKHRWVWEQAHGEIPEGYNVTFRDGDSRNCSKYGRLYNHDEALHACPSGWRLPNKEDFESLVNAAGGLSKAGEALKSTSGWFKKGDGSDALGFNALPAGYGSQGKFDGIGGYAYFWSSTDSEDGLAYYLFLDFSSKGAALNAFDKGSARSVRCVK